MWWIARLKGRLTGDTLIVPATVSGRAIDAVLDIGSSGPRCRGDAGRLCARPAFAIIAALGAASAAFGCPILCRSEEHTPELQSLMRYSFAVFCLKKKKNTPTTHHNSKI